MIEKKQRRPLNSEELRAARNLESVYLAKKKELGLTYEKIGAKFDWSPAAAQQYIKGLVPLNMEALIKICSALVCNPVEIYPELFENIIIPIDDDSAMLAKLKMLDDKTRHAITVLIENAYQNAAQ